MLIQLYIYNKSNGEFLYEDTGNVENITNDLEDSQDFTTTPLPDAISSWCWVGNEWQPNEIYNSMDLPV